ncbi:hypothetical protein SAMN05216369_1441 [Marinobacter antarcticus]|uniref:Uncharacterized protein n=1 Tax=Marinobacter antarcticus TaxID=564117 RepID=A0A1M6RDE7_9GAMM|nr:hypothetical protein [Marinobacter antarcticus]SHK30494.1 hypothetical protein SAMN05216369_1441 [Marinobacter antarcticus]
MKKLLLIFGMAMLMAAVFSIIAKPVPIEQKLINIHARDVLGDFPGIEQESVEIQAILLDMSDDPLLLLKAQAAFMRYPDMARNLFPLYAAEPEFQDILRRYGEDVLPPIQYFVSRPISTIEWMNRASRQYQAAKRFFTGTPEASRPDSQLSNEREELSPGERGWYAVNFIQSEGHDFLGQFIVDSQGATQWIGTERVLEGMNQFFASGIRDLERNYRFDNEITAGDVGWASVDVLIFASAVKILRVGRAAAVTTKGASRGTRSAALAARVTRSGKMVLSSARYAKWPLIVGAGYLVITHPSIINDLFAGVADILGYPVAAVQFVGWLLLLIPALYIGSWLLWLLAPLLMALLRSMSHLVAVLSGRRHRHAGYGKL